MRRIAICHICERDFLRRDAHDGICERCRRRLSVGTGWPTKVEIGAVGVVPTAPGPAQAGVASTERITQ